MTLIYETSSVIFRVGKIADIMRMLCNGREENCRKIFDWRKVE